MPEIVFRPLDYAYPLELLRRCRAFERNQWLEPEALRRHTARRLLETLEHAARDVPYYREAFAAASVTPRGLAFGGQLEKLPLLDRATLRRERTRLEARGSARYRPREACTSGTTGEPARFLLDRHSRVLEFAYYWRHFSWAGYRLGTPFAQLSATEFLRAPGVPYLTQRLTRRLLLNSNLLGERIAPVFLQALRRYRPRYLKGLAGPLAVLAGLLDGRASDLGLQGVFSTGEALTPSRRRLIERAFGARVLDSYGLTEQVAAISECPSGGLHVNTDYAHVELVPSPYPGLRWIVGSTLHNRAMPLLRYHTRDLAEPAEPGARCPCGRSLPLVRAVHGRAEDAVITADGRILTTLFLAAEVAADVGQLQFVQGSRHRLVVRVAREEEHPPHVLQRVVERAQRLCGHGMEVALERPAGDSFVRGPTGKLPLVVSELAREVPGATP